MAVNRMNMNARVAIETIEAVLLNTNSAVQRIASKNLGSAKICTWSELPLMSMRSIKNRLTRAGVKYEAGADLIVILAPANFNFEQRCERIANAA